MIPRPRNNGFSFSTRVVSVIVTVAFLFTSVISPSHAQSTFVSTLPEPGTMVETSAAFSPLALRGIVVNPQKPLELQFIVDTGLGPQDKAAVKEQTDQLVKYFLAGLTIPEGDLWVNLSPYEKNSIVPDALGQTELGRDLLAQDYILKQLSASLLYPEKDLGEEFWKKVYQKVQEQFGSTDIPVNTFNKVWILPDQAQVFEKGGVAYITKTTLKVMLDEDYLSKQKNQSIKASSISSQIVREIFIPEIEKEVNTGKNFAPLRQIYQALILAKWYKETIQNGLYDTVYIDKNKVAGVSLDDPTIKEQIYERYLEAFKKGAFNYIKKDPMPDGQAVPRRYFSGGTKFSDYRLDRTHGGAIKAGTIGILLLVTVGLGFAIKHVPQLLVSSQELAMREEMANLQSVDLSKRISALQAIGSSVKYQPRMFDSLIANLNEQETFSANRTLVGEEVIRFHEKEKVVLRTLETIAKIINVDPRFLEILKRLANNSEYVFRRHVILTLGTNPNIPKYAVGNGFFYKIMNEENESSWGREFNGYDDARKALVHRKDIRLINNMQNFKLILPQDNTLFDLIYYLDQIPTRDEGFFSDDDFFYVIRNPELLIKKIEDNFNTPQVINAAAKMDTWSDEKLIKYLPFILRGKLQVPMLASYSGLQRLTYQLKLAGLAKRSDHVKALIDKGYFHLRDFLFFPDINRRIYSEPPRYVEVKIPDVYFDGHKLNRNSNVDYLDTRSLFDYAKGTTTGSNKPKPLSELLKELGVDSTPTESNKPDAATEPLKKSGGSSPVLETPEVSRVNLPTDKGGVDLNQIHVLRTGKTINVQFDPAQVNELMHGGFEGFTPVIINITPISSVLPILGLQEPMDQEKDYPEMSSLN